MKHIKQLRLVRQDEHISIRVVLLNDDGDVVHIGDEAYQFTSTDIDKLILLHEEACLCFKRPILHVPSKRGKHSGKMEALTFEPDEWEGEYE